MGWRSLVHLCLIFSLALGPTTAIAADGGNNIRLRDRQPGLYLAPLPNPADIEAENFTSTQAPLAPLDAEEIQKYIAEHPELADHKLVIIGPAVRGEQAADFKKAAEASLTAAGISAPVQIIRHPQTLREKIWNLWPRAEDYEKPSSAELKVMMFKVTLAESLSFAVLLLPPIFKSYGIEIGPEIDKIVNQIALPMKVAVAMCVMDVANMVPLISFRRALSNHNIRLNPMERFLRQFLMSLFFSFNFYALSQSPAIAERVADGSLQGIWDYLSQTRFGDIGADGWSQISTVGGVIVPASVLNMLARTTVGTSQNIWEQRAPNRRFMTAILEAVTGLVIAPAYILSTMPFLEPVVQTPVMDLNAAHLGMLGMGAAGAAAWLGLERKVVTAWIADKANACISKLQALGRFLLLGRRSTREQSDGENQSGQG